MINKNDIKIKDLKTSKNISDIVRISNDLNIVIKDIDRIYPIRILIYIINKLRNNQFINEQQQLSISFDEDFLSDENIHTEFVLNVSELNIKGNDKDKIKQALEYLENFKKDWYDIKNRKNETYQVYGGLINNPKYFKGKGKVSFTISSYWLEKLLNIGSSYYNETMYRIAFILSSSKQYNFYMWLHTIKGQTQGIIKSLDSFNSEYNLSYKEEKIFCINFFKPIKKILDEYSDISFNYKNLGKNKGILIIPYLTKNVNTKDLKETTKLNLQTKYTLYYLKKRHMLDNKNLEYLNKFKDDFTMYIITQGYKYFIGNCRKQNIPATNYKRDEFLKEFQRCIIIMYNSSNRAAKFPNSFPKIF